MFGVVAWEYAVVLQVALEAEKFPVVCDCALILQLEEYQVSSSATSASKTASTSFIQSATSATTASLRASSRTFIRRLLRHFWKVKDGYQELKETEP